MKIPRAVRRCLILLIAAVGAVSLCPAQNTLLDYMQRVRNETGVPGLSVAVAVNSEIVFSGGVGYAELDNRTRQTGRTVHNAGSVSKVLAATAVMQLVERGKLRLDDELQTWLPYYPRKSRPITLRQALTHTSGTRHYKDGEFGEHRLSAKRYYTDFEQATRLWRDDPLIFDPGAYWSYSSHAMNLLHGIVEKAGGEDFEDYMRGHIFEPAGMTASQFDVYERVIHNRGHGYRRNENGQLVHAPFEDPSYKFAGGGMLSTVDDLVRFVLALNAGKLLSERSLERMYEPQLDASIERFNGGDPRPLDFQQALAWRISSDPAGRRYVSHGGSVKGAKTFLANYRDQDVIVAIQGNLQSFNPRPWAIAIAHMYLPANAGGL